MPVTYREECAVTCGKNGCVCESLLTRLHATADAGEDDDFGIELVDERGDCTGGEDHPNLQRTLAHQPTIRAMCARQS